MNRERVRLALSSTRDLAEVINAMTEEEILKALELESSAQRRKSVLTRLIGRLTHMREARWRNELMEQYLP